MATMLADGLLVFLVRFIRQAVPYLVFGAESTRWPDSLQRAGASEKKNQLLAWSGSGVGALDEEALGEEWSDGNEVNSTLSNDIKDTG